MGPGIINYKLHYSKRSKFSILLKNINDGIGFLLNIVKNASSQKKSRAHAARHICIVG
jgi:hypothetical protein